MEQTLFKTDKNGRRRMFKISVEELADGSANIVKETGLVDGKKIQSIIHVILGLESALKRAQTMFENQKELPVTPMLANKWDDKKKKIKGPFYVQPKLDGVRLIVSNKGGLSRTGKIVAGTEKWGKHLKDGEYLDGECYVHGMKFEDITSAFKTAPEKLEYHIFDKFNVNNLNVPFSERLKDTNIECRYVEDPEQISKIHEEFVNKGYEGIMIRTANGPYEMCRSNHLLKYKTFQTDEFKVVGVHEGTGRDQKTPVWECETASGETFSVKPEGSVEYKKELWLNKHKHIGKMLTVRYQNATSRGVPRFPVGLVFRDYE